MVVLVLWCMGCHVLATCAVMPCCVCVCVCVDEPKGGHG